MKRFSLRGGFLAAMLGLCLVAGQGRTANITGGMALEPDAANATFPAIAQNLVMALNVRHFGAIGDGSSHPLSTRYATLAAAQAVCPEATSLTQEIDWCAAQAAIDYAETKGAAGSLSIRRGIAIEWPDGYFMHGTSSLNANNVSLVLRGRGAGNSFIQFTNSAGNNLLNFGTNSHMGLVNDSSATVTTGGSGYTNGDVLTCVGGTVATTACRLTVTGVSGGAVTSFTILTAGDYGTPPTATGIAVTGGAGTGFTFKAPNWTPKGGFLIVERMNWVANGTGGIAINAQFNIGIPTLTVRDMTFQRGGSGYWGQPIHCMACSYSVVEHNRAIGDQDNSTDFSYFEDTNALVGHYSLKFFDNYSNGFQNGYHIVSGSTTGIQGPRWIQNDHVQGRRFLYFEAPGGTGPPQYTLIDNEAAISGWFFEATHSLQDFKAIGNEIFIGSGNLASSPATGGGFKLTGDQGSYIAGNRMSITHADVPTVDFLISTGSHGVVVNNTYGNPAGVTANGVTLDTGSDHWYERGQNPIGGITASVIDRGIGNDTSLSPAIQAPVITGGATISGNVVLNNLLKLSTNAAATAAGTDQSTCFAMTETLNRFSNVASGTGACLTNFQNSETVVLNAGANPLLVYPASGSSASINGAAANAPVSVPVGAAWRFGRFNSTIIIGSDLNLGGLFSAGIQTPKSYITAANGGTSSLTCNQAAVFDHTSGIAGYTVNMPTSPAEGCWVSLGTAFNITTLTMADPASHPIAGALTTITATTPAAWVYHASRWYRCNACE